MKNLPLLLCFLAFCNHAYSQSNKEQALEIAQTNHQFSEFLSLFPGKEIPPALQENILKIEGPFPEQRLQFETRIAKQIVRQTTKYSLVTVQYQCGAGGLCGSVKLYSFDPGGNIISSVELSEEFADCGFQDTIEPVYFSGGRLITKSRKWEGNCINRTTQSETETVTAYNISPTGKIIKEYEQQIELRREYNFLSKRLVKEAELAGVKGSELAVMRNELFAAYGYIFKTKKWAVYFGKTDWYKPTTNQVSESDLSFIEQQNLKLIKKMEGLK